MKTVYETLTNETFGFSIIFFNGNISTVSLSAYLSILTLLLEYSSYPKPCLVSSSFFLHKSVAESALILIKIGP